MALTDSACKNFKPDAKAYKKADSNGLYMEVSPKGTKYWRYKYRFMGKENRLAFGIYPEVSLAEAREKREIARKQLAQGQDPAFVKKEQKRANQLKAENTFELIAREWHTHNLARWKESHGNNILHRLEKDIFPIIGKRPIDQIKPYEILDLLRKIEGRGAFDVAKRTRQTCGQVFNYAVITNRAETNPTISLVGALKPVKKGHYAAFTDKELPEFIGKLERNDVRSFPHTRLAMKLIMLTFVRTSELIGMRWDEVNFEKKQWIIPPERMKMKRAHIVPLCTQALEILHELKPISMHSEFVFPSLVHPKKHMSNGTILVALKRMGYKGVMTGHGFRSLAMSTIKEKLGWRHEVVDRQLAHAQKNKVDAAYDRAQFLDDRTIMMQQWADYLEGMNNTPKPTA